MINLIEQIKYGKIWTFHGGIHPPENKLQTCEQAILPMEIPSEIILPIKQHIGLEGLIIVSVGDLVLKGQPLTKSDNLQSVPIHAPTSGYITAIEPRTIAHPSGLSELCIVIRCDFNDTWYKKSAIKDHLNASEDTLINHIKDMGISGMGGAGFPTARKLQASLARTGILIINGAECEPYISADDRLMQEHAYEIIDGIEILRRIVKPSLTIIAIEDNKAHAIKAVIKAIQNRPDIIVQVIPTLYPSGGERQLVKILTGKEVPSQSIPLAIGFIVQNVATAYAIKRAVVDGEPLISRVITLAGNSLEEQCNRWVLNGTSINNLLKLHGYSPQSPSERLIVGGPLMGFTLPHAHVPTTKTTNCILAPTQKEIPLAKPPMPCIRCSDCADVCPVSLLPQQLQWYASTKELDKCQNYGLLDCIECGACAHVCPSDIPLVQYFRQAKAQLHYQQEQEQASQKARLRFDAKKARLARDKKIREENNKIAAELRQRTMQQNSQQNAVNAAIARLKQKAQQKMQPNAADENLKQLREQRKQQAREKQQNVSSSTPQSSMEPTTKNAAVSAAILRAKAKKLAQAQAETITTPSNEHVSTLENVQKDDVVSIALNSDDKTHNDKTSLAGESLDNKKAAIAAAILRAKAKKQAQASALTTQAKGSESFKIKPIDINDPLAKSPMSSASSLSDEAEKHTQVNITECKKNEHQIDIKELRDESSSEQNSSKEQIKDPTIQTEDQQKTKQNFVFENANYLNPSCYGYGHSALTTKAIIERITTKTAQLKDDEDKKS